MNEQYLAANPHVINQIVERDLCVRCGACEPACPVDIIKFNERAYPYITNEDACITSCTRCLKVCPGEVVDFGKLDEEMFGTHPHPASVTGIARRALVSFAADDQVREGGASGGFVTQLLLYLLDRGAIDGALVLGVAQDQQLQLEPFIARTAAELRRAAKSKYMVVPSLTVLREMEQIEGRYAVVGLPCYIHSLRKYQKVSKKLRERIRLVIGLQCNVVFEPYVFDELCDFKKIKPEVVSLDFRHGDWPGGIVAQLRDGRTQKILQLEEWKDEFNLLKLLYTAPRCNMCIDFSAEYADITVGDPWLRGADGEYLFPDGRTSVLIRSEVGDEMVRQAVAAGYLDVKEISLKTYMTNFESNARYKRDFVPKYMKVRKFLGLPVPEYHRPTGDGKLGRFLPVLLRSAIGGLAKFRWFRRLGIGLAQTPLALACWAWNRRRKERKFVTAYPKLERFVDELRLGSNKSTLVSILILVDPASFLL